jgi:hypothetical protein
MRAQRWARIDPDKRTEWAVRLRDIIRKQSQLSMVRLEELMRIDKWKILILLAPLIDEAKVFVTRVDSRDLPTEICDRDHENTNTG